jgi:hypothetical protein
MDRVERDLHGDVGGDADLGGEGLGRLLNGLARKEGLRNIGHERDSGGDVERNIDSAGQGGAGNLGKRKPFQEYEPLV